MFVNSEGGYVLGGSKPVCMEGILAPNKTRVRWLGAKMHRRSVDLWQGYQVWRRHFAAIPSKKLIISCKDHADHLYSDWIHLIWINPQKCLEVVSTHLELFQYVLGPQLTPNSFLDYLADPSQDLPHDYTLTGIFLGFGSQNALYYHRLELIQKEMFSRETLPLKVKSERLNIPCPKEYLGFEQTCSASTQPSFGFATLSEEYLNLEKLGSTSSEAASLSMFKIPLFAIYKKDKETRDLIARYQKDRKMIAKLLESSHFLEDTLREIFE